MAKKLVLFLVLLCAIEISLAAVAIEMAPVNDPELKAKGYSCYNKIIGPMKTGEVNNNFSQQRCEKVTCGNGVFNYESCGVYKIEGQPNRPIDPTKPFPECCNYPF